MRKILIITGLGMALSLSGANVASAQAATRPERQNGAQQDGARRGRGGPGGMLLKDITLNADQKAKVTALRERQRAQFDAQRKTAQARTERQRGDTTGFGARRAEMEQRRTAQVNEMRAILNSTQRVQFDKNVAEMKTRMAKGGRDGDGKKQNRKPGEQHGGSQSR